jgi:hypothetical protein
MTKKKIRAEAKRMTIEQAQANKITSKGGEELDETLLKYITTKKKKKK